MNTNQQLEMYEEYSEVSDQKTKQYGGKLWEVNDRLAGRQDMKFAEKDSNPFMDFVYEACGGSPLETCSIPKGMIAWMEKSFMPMFKVRESKYADLYTVIDNVFRYLDYTEPYFFISDMPISLSANAVTHTYRFKNNGSVIDPMKMEIFTVNTGWKFQHYQYVHNFLKDPRVQETLRKEGEPTNPWDDQNRRTQEDVFKVISEAVFGGYDYLRGVVDGWVTDYFDGLKYECKDSYERGQLDDHQVLDATWWLVVTLGCLTWIKSPYGLRFLTNYHPIYAELLEWDEEIQKIRVRKETGGEVIVLGWGIYTLQDIEKLENVPPGTCCVTQQALHCTKLVNATYVKNPMCYCGTPRDFLDTEYSAGHYSHQCRKYEADHPDQHTFISYGALANILAKRPMTTKCDRTTCPNTSCKLHAGEYARVRTLTNQRTKLLTSSPVC